MTSHMVDGRRIPDRVAGHPALELCNTRAGWGSASPKEYLVDFPTLAIWARENGLVSAAEARGSRTSAATQPRHAGAALRAVLDFRSTLYGVLTTGDRAALVRLHAFVSRAVARSRYVGAGSVLVLDGGTGPMSIVDRCALSAHRLLEEHGRDAVGCCGGADCGWLFLDPTRRRRWCVMAVCGNRAKARRYAERHRASVLL